MKFWQRKRFEEEMDAELRFHMECFEADLIRSGVSPAEAARRARAEFGPMEAKKDECRQAWGWQFFDELTGDIRIAFRAFRWNPGFAAVAVLSLALGIGANTAIFGLVDAVILRYLPVRDPAALVFVRTAGSIGADGPPYPLFELIRDQARSFESVAAFSHSNMEFTADRGREQVRGVWVSPNFYETLGVRPVWGRSLTASDGEAAVISSAYWRQRFGEDPGVVGRTVQLFNHSVTIVGVMPSEIMTVEPGVPLDIAVPIQLSDPAKLRDHTSLWLETVARLKPGVSPEQARVETGVLFQGYMADVPIRPQIREMLYQRMELPPAGRGLNSLRSQYAKPLTVLMILAALVLVAACVNTANLLLARASARQREFAVRLAIGAGRGRLIRQCLTEALTLTGSGALAGIALGFAAQKALLAFFAEGNIAIDLPFNAMVVLFTIGITVLSGLAVGLYRRCDRPPKIRAFQEARGAGRVLVAVQVALSVVLLAGAGLFLRSLWELQAVDLGFDRETILTMEVAPERQMNGTPAWLAQQAELLERVRTAPGVRAAGWATMNPMSGRDRGAVIDFAGFAPRIERDKHVHLAAVSPGYFDALGLPLRLGRDIGEGDSAAALKVAVLNETAAKFYFPAVSPIGQKIRFTNYQARDLVYEVVGVVKDSKHDSLREEASRFLYVPIPQSLDPINRLALAARCFGDATIFAAPVRRLFQEPGSTLLVSNISTMERDIERSLRRERLMAGLSAVFGAVSAILACIGLYGILSYAVARRTKELGIRMALGATRGAVVGLVVKEAVVLAVAGIVLGLPLLLGLGRMTRALLFGVDPLDPVVIAGTAAVLLACAGVSGLIPGRRAGMLDPTVALRQE